MSSDKLQDTVNKIPFGLFLVMYLGYLGFDYYNFVNDPASPLIAKNHEIEVAKENKVRYAKKLQEFKTFSQTLDSKKVELRQLAKELQGMKDSLSDTVDIPSFMKMVITEAKRVGMTVESLKPTGNVNKEYYSEQTFSLKYKGFFEQVTSFMQRLSNVTEIVRVDRFEMRPSAASAGRYMMLEGSIDIKTYKYLGTNADSMGKTDTTSAGKDAKGGS